MALNIRDSLAKTRLLQHALFMLSLSFAWALAGCDSFSLLDMLDPLTLTAATTTVARNGAPVALNVSGGRPPYSFSVAAVDLYAGTSTLPIGDVFNQAYVPGEAIGRIRIVATDENGEVVNLYFNVVPIAPTLVLKNQAPDVRIEWNYSDTVAVNSIRIDKSVNSSLFALRHTSTSMEDHFLDTGVLVGGIASLSYRCYSVAGTYVSIPAEGSLLP